MRIAIGSDEAAYQLKMILRKYMEEKGIDVEDFGTHDNKPVLYPDIAYTVATAVANGEFERAVLLCGTGIGMAITANKVPGVRAALCHDTYSAEKSRTSNNAQILTMGGRVIGPELAKRILGTWLSFDFAGGPSAKKLSRICHYENQLAHNPPAQPVAAAQAKGSRNDH